MMEGGEGGRGRTTQESSAGGERAGGDGRHTTGREINSKQVVVIKTSRRERKRDNGRVVGGNAAWHKEWAGRRTIDDRGGERAVEWVVWWVGRWRSGVSSDCGGCVWLPLKANSINTHSFAPPPHRPFDEW